MKIIIGILFLILISSISSISAQDDQLQNIQEKINDIQISITNNHKITTEQISEYKKQIESLEHELSELKLNLNLEDVKIQNEIEDLDLILKNNQIQLNQINSGLLYHDKTSNFDTRAWSMAGIAVAVGLSSIAFLEAIRSERNTKKFIKVQRHMQDANTAFVLKNYENAKQHYDLASKIDPKNIVSVLIMP